MSFKYYSPIGFLSLHPNINIINFDYRERLGTKFNFEKTQLYNDKTNIIVMNNHPASIEYFAKNILPFIQYKFIIISFCCDTTFPNECNGWWEEERIKRGNNYESIINNTHFVHWFATNKITPNNEKSSYIPYGLCYWILEYFPNWGCPVRTSKEQDDILCRITDNSLHFSNRIPKIFANWHLNKTDSRHGAFRTHLQNIIPKNIIYYSNQQSRDSYWEECSKYAFVVSPHGNGLDCIRTWESLCLGCIVIVKKSDIDHLYDELPVLIVNDWHDITEELLYKTIDIFSKKQFNMEKITMKYWIDKINEKLLYGIS
jgi:hypothetical protein